VNIFIGFAAAQAKGELDFVSSELKGLLGRKTTSLRIFKQGV